MFLRMHYQDPLRRVGGVQWFVPEDMSWSDRSELLPVVRACQLKRLYQLFGYDPMTWKKAVSAEEVDEKVGVFSGRSVSPAQFADWRVITHRILDDVYNCDRA